MTVNATVHGPRSVASNDTTRETCTECGREFIGEVYVDTRGLVTHQCTTPSGQIVCDDCAGHQS